MEALIFAEILKPLAGPLGALGETAIGEIAQRSFVRPPR
jgi:hypothetical protein